MVIIDNKVKMIGYMKDHGICGCVKKFKIDQNLFLEDPMKYLKTMSDEIAFDYIVARSHLVYKVGDRMLYTCPFSKGVRETTEPNIECYHDYN